MTSADLKTRSVKDLASMAKKKKVSGWSAMRKEQLIKALLKQSKQKQAKSAPKPVVSDRKSNSKVTKQPTLAVVNGAISSRPAARNGVTVKSVVSKTNIVKNGASDAVAAVLNGKTPARQASLNGASAASKKEVLVKATALTAAAVPTHVNGAKLNGSAKLNGNKLNGSPKEIVPKEIAPVAEAKPLPVAVPLKKRSPQVERRLQQVKTRHAEAKDISFRTLDAGDGPAKDRLVVMVLEPYWLHCYWELSRRSVQRAEAAMGALWHAAHPILRLLEVSRNGTTSASRQAVRDIEIHGGVNNWYIDVANPPKGYQVEIGYLAPGGKFFCLGRSNGVTTPAPGSSETFDRNWAGVAKQFDRIYAMTAGAAEQESTGDLKDILEEQLHRPIGDGLASQVGPGASGGKNGDFQFQVDTELIVHGATRPDARVTLRGEPVPLRSDGSFAVRFNLPDRRHVLPVVAQSGDGAEQRTIVLAVDRNTKVMEPVVRDPGERS